MPAELADPNYTPPLAQAVPLAIQHILAMFVSNVTPAIILAGAAGFGFGSNSSDFPSLLYMIQMAMVFAGIATLLQTISIGPIGARLPIVQGTSFAFIPVMMPLVAGRSVHAMAAVMGGVLVGGLMHMCLGLFIKRIRFAFPPLVTGLVVLMIGLALIKIGIQYGSALNWITASIVIVGAFSLKFFTRGMLSAAAVLVGMAAGYLFALTQGMVSYGNIGNAAYFAVPQPFYFGVEFTAAAIISMCLMSFVSAVETVGDVSGITKGGANREATDDEIQGATYADGLGTALAGPFGGLPNTSFSQNVGLGRPLEPGALQHLSGTVKILLSSGLLPAAVVAMVLNILLPEEIKEA